MYSTLIGQTHFEDDTYPILLLVRILIFEENEEILEIASLTIRIIFYIWNVLAWEGYLGVVVLKIVCFIMSSGYINGQKKRLFPPPSMFDSIFPYYKKNPRIFKIPKLKKSKAKNPRSKLFWCVGSFCNVDDLY